MLLLIATVVMWVRSTRHTEYVTWSRLTQRDDPASDFVPLDRYYAVYVGAGAGCLVVGYGNTWSQSFNPPPRWQHVRFAGSFDFRDPTGSVWARHGFTWDKGPPPEGLTDLAAPCWAVAAALALLPAAWSLRRLATLRAGAAGLCVVCGYDLRASTDRCPECGTPIPVEAKA